MVRKYFEVVKGLCAREWTMIALSVFALLGTLYVLISLAIKISSGQG